MQKLKMNNFDLKTKNYNEIDLMILVQMKAFMEVCKKFLFLIDAHIALSVLNKKVDKKYRKN